MKIILSLKKKFFESGGVETFIFEPTPTFTYVAGQYLRYSLSHENEDQRGANRFFTIASAPFEGFIQLTTKISDPSSSFKQALQMLKINDQVEAEGPMGSFVFDPNVDHTIWIAGGIGITPFRAILNQLNFVKLNPKVVLLYANKTPEFTFKSLLDTLASKLSNLKLIYTVDQPSPGWFGNVGKIGEDFIKKCITDILTPNYYVSGPEAMVNSFINMLESMGIDRLKIKRDAFPGYNQD